MGGKADQNLTKLTVGLFENEGYVLKKKVLKTILYGASVKKNI